MTWPLARVGDLAEQIRGVTFAKGDTSPVLTAGLLPVMTATNVTELGLVNESVLYLPRSKVGANQVLRKNDLLVTASSGSLSVVGRAVLVRDELDATFGAFCKVLRPRDGVDPHYFAHFFRTSDYRSRVSRLAAGANINNLRNEDLDGFEIPLPPLPEQRRIASILDEVDGLRAARSATAINLDASVEGLFDSMFKDRFPHLPLSQLGTVITGRTPPSSAADSFGDAVPFVTPGDLEREGPPRRFLSSNGADLVPVVRRGSLLVCCIGATVGKMGMARQALGFNQQVNAVEWGETILPGYGFYAAKRMKPAIVSAASSTTMPILNKSAFARLTLPVPPLHLQSQFQDSLDLYERARKRQLAHLAKLDELFASLQYLAFRGEL